MERGLSSGRAKVRLVDKSVGYSTVWRNLKLICKVGLAYEVNIGDGITRYDRVTDVPHGHLYCLNCKKLTEFNVEQLISVLAHSAGEHNFSPDSFKIEIQGYCQECEKIISNSQQSLENDSLNRENNN